MVQDSWQLSQEFQLTGASEKLKWVAGLYYFHQSIEPMGASLGINLSVPQAPFVVPVRLSGTSETDAYAVFGQLTWYLTDAFSLTGGLRYSYEDRSGVNRTLIPAFGLDELSRGEKSFDDFSPKFTLSYQATPELLLYATVSKGFQSGGFDAAAQPPPGGSIVTFDPETIWDYEGGLKYRNHWLDASLAAFHYKYSDLQVSQIVNGLPQTANAASSKIDGIELAAAIGATEYLSLSGSFAYIDSKFEDFIQFDELAGQMRDLSGNRLPGAPRSSVNLAANYIIPLGEHAISLTGEWNWHDRIYFTEFNSPQVSQPQVSTFNAAMRFLGADDRWYVEVFGKNLSDELIATQKWITGLGFGGMVLGNLALPRTYGAKVHYAF